ncbi:major facilitator superfamily domain-containing protein [Xylariaceae sp. FL0016]|nr:major facilitator superfamily domain-containing protein [Xylariaceae sp. FL0016]
MTEGQVVEKQAIVPLPQDENGIVAQREDSIVPISSHQDEPPDGGWVAWSQVLPACLGTAMSWGYGTAYAVFQLYYKQTMNLPTAQISWVGSVQLFLYFVVGSISGRLSDAGYTRALYVTGGAIGVLGMFMTSLATDYWQLLLAQGFCSGVGGGLMFMPGIANVGTYFRKRRTFAMSLNACGSSLGAILFPAIIQYLTPRIGLPWAVRVCGFISLFMVTTGSLLLRPRKLRRTRAPLVDWHAFRYWPFTIFTAGGFLLYFSIFTLMIYINSFAREIIGLSDLESVNFLLITNAVAVPARPLFGLFADRYIGPINTLGLTSIALGVTTFGWIRVHERTGMYVYSIAMGFINGAAQGVFPGAASSLVNDVTKIGTWIGMVFAICGFAALSGPPTMGAIIDANDGSFLQAQLWAGFVVIMGGFLVLVASWLVGTKTTGTARRKAQTGWQREGV